MHDIIGKTAKDTVTGFHGLVTARCEYLTGPARLQIAAPADKSGAFREPEWFDEERCQIVAKKRAKT